MRLLVLALGATVFMASAATHAGQWPVSEARLSQLERGSETDRIQAASLLPHAGQGIRLRLFASLLSDSSPEVRLRAIEAALAAPSSELGILVAPLVLDGDRNVAMRALDFVRHAGSEEAVSWLEQLLLRPDPELKAAALEALGVLEGASGPEVESILIAALRDAEPVVRLAASRGLAWRGGERSLPSLSFLLRDPDARVRSEAARALAAVGGPIALSFLRLVVLESSPLERRAILPAFLEMPESRSEPRLFPLVLESFLGHPDALDAEILRKIAPITDDPWILRALALARSPAHRPAIARLFVDRDEAEEGTALETFRDRVLRCQEREPGALCHQIGAELLGDADERRIVAYREGRLRAPDVFRGIDLAQHRPLSFLAFEMLEDPAPSVRNAALIALSASSHELIEEVEPLVLLLKSKEPSREERAVILSLLGRSASPRARSAIELFERSSVLSIRHLAEDARLGQLFQDPAPDCLELKERVRAVQKRLDSPWGQGRARQISLPAYACLVRSIRGLHALERDRLERLLLDAHIEPPGAQPNAIRAELAREAFSLALAARGEERALLMQITLTLDLPKEVRRAFVRDELDPETSRQVAASILIRSGHGAHADLPLSGAERAQQAERACRDVRSPSEIVRVQALILAGALGPDGVLEPCWRSATLGAYATSQPRVRLTALLAAKRSPENEHSARVLRLCRLSEKDPIVLRWCSRDPFRSPETEAKADRSLVSLRLPGRPAGQLSFVAFVAFGDELGVEMGMTDWNGRFLARADREYLEFVVFE